MPFVAPTPYQPTHPKALAIYCSDGRFTQAVEELLHHLGHPRLDTLTVPGGPGLLNPWTASLLESDQIKRAAQFLIRGHALDHVVLLAHAGCGYYRQKYPGRPTAELRKSQVEDLRIAARAIHATRSGIKVDLYYAVNDEGSVRFEEVSGAI
jgi:hypothetical protein